ncbi:HNH endonuclease [Bacillus phage 1_ICo-2020]|uniref:HNH endonuclease n=1 Tax=Bacillus phage 1_ICo-2020 TaxID=2759272 RepID=A0A7G8AKF3_9CAUD|nr:HNH endonuclease [Bacillus phage 1_ICo-2020]
MEIKEFPLNPNILVSTDGRIFSKERMVYNGKGYFLKPSRELKLQKSHKGYYVFSVGKGKTSKTWPVHRVVAITFIPNIANKPQINHKDGIKTNNNISNLEWCTNSENQLHAYKNGLNKRSEKAGKSKRKVICIDTNTVYDSIAECARDLGYKKASNIGSVCKGIRPHALGMKFKYVE